MVRARSTSVNSAVGAELRHEDVDTLFLVWLAARPTEALVDATLAPAELTGDEYALMSVLEARTTATPTDLVRWMGAPPTSVSSHLKRLEARGHITRSANPDDRRSTLIQLTPAGRQVRARAAALFGPVCEEVAQGLAGRVDEVRDALLRVREVVDDVRAGRPGE